MLLTSNYVCTRVFLLKIIYKKSESKMVLSFESNDDTIDRKKLR